MNALTTLVLELDLPVIAVVAFSAYTYLKGKFTQTAVAQTVVAQTLTYRQRAIAKNASRLAA